jgi:cysteine desulfurase
MLSLSGHKLGAPKGIGVLYKKRNVQIEPIIHGGVHEYGKRAGTENVSAIVGLGKAIELTNKREADRIKKLRDYLESKIIKKIDGAVINGSKIDRLPNISNLSFKNVEGESVVLSLDLEGIAVSTGSACTSGSLQPSHVLMAMDKNPKKAHSSVRFSLGWGTKKTEIDQIIKILPVIIKRLRAISPFKEINA